MREARENYKQKHKNDFYRELLSILEKATEEKEALDKTELMELIESLEEKLDKDIKAAEEAKQRLINRDFDRSVFPVNGEIFCEGDKMLLRVIKDTEKEDYISVSYEYSSSKSSFKDELFIQDLWDEFIGEHVFSCSIIDMETKSFVGYCSIKDLRDKEWEIAIELQAEWCHKGYGTEALPLFVKNIAELTGRKFFRVRVDIDNYASQALMKKIGADPNGVSEFLLRGDDLEAFKKENLHLIDDKICNVAKEFCMEPEDILGLVLEYCIDVDRMNGV